MHAYIQLGGILLNWLCMFTCAGEPHPTERWIGTCGLGWRQHLCRIRAGSADRGELKQTMEGLFLALICCHPTERWAALAGASIFVASKLEVLIEVSRDEEKTDRGQED